ncbi:MAG: primosomal protein N', partial [Candidatus Competibacteraceae bacterium]|nr:primosomal protein N' [Candidatus Competibacteraceae bacterium]
LELANWSQRYYHHPPGEVFSTLLPALLRQGRAVRRKEEPLWRVTAAGHTALVEDKLRRAPRQRLLLEYLAVHSAGVQAIQLRRELPDTTKTVRVLQDKGWIEAEFNQPDLVERPVPPPLPNRFQDEAVTGIVQSLNEFAVFLLDGVTGSGKTEVYLRTVEAVLARGDQALLLVPEIGLTPQLLMRFRERVTAPLAVLHSNLTDWERLDAWTSAQNGVASVVIGTRSAVFAPLRRPGVIIIDEEHDLSFKQQDGFRYHARDLAVVRARQWKVPVLLGSATPSLESLQNVRSGRYRYLRLPERVGDAVEPAIEVLDVRRQRMEEGLSTPLLDRMRVHLAQDGQVLLFLNRRGFAPTLICHECGWLAQCQRCDARMTVHLQRQQLICHHCGAQQSVNIACPSCGSIDLRALGQGTERLERVLKREFPAVGIARIDRDSTRRKGSLQTLLSEIHDGKRRILIGTQMLAKGHHFPAVTLAGIVDADQGLFGSDFRSSERMAQLIVQVAGRAGRAHRPGTVVIQTHHPQHPLLRVLVTEGYSAFAMAALEERREAQLPPFTWQALLRAEAQQPDLPHCFLREAMDLGGRFVHGVELFGPVPAPMERRAGRYRAQLLVQAIQRRHLHEFLGRWVEQLGTLKTARKVRWSLDVDPQDLL